MVTKKKATGRSTTSRWSCGNGALVQEGRAPLRHRFFIWMGQRTEEPQRGEGRSKISLSKLIDEYARSHPRVPAPVQGAGGVRQDVLGARGRAEGPGLHDDVVEGISRISVE